MILSEPVFPDEHFRAYVYENFDTDGNGVLSGAEMLAVTSINVSGTAEEPGEITSLKGIEYFTSLRSLGCQYNQLTSLDLSRNTALESFNAGGNKLTGYSVTNFAKLDNGSVVTMGQRITYSESEMLTFLKRVKTFLESGYWK